jgi:hypothetical protein
MAKIHIDEATNEQLDYAAAVAQEWHKEGGNWCDRDCQFKGYVDNYHPTTNQAQCGDLIDGKKINIRWNVGNCETWTGIDHAENRTRVFSHSKMIAVVKSFLWAVYPDGMIEIE